MGPYGTGSITASVYRVPAGAAAENRALATTTHDACNPPRMSFAGAPNVIVAVVSPGVSRSPPVVASAATSRLPH